MPPNTIEVAIEIHDCDDSEKEKRKKVYIVKTLRKFKEISVVLSEMELIATCSIPADIFQRESWCNSSRLKLNISKTTNVW